MIRKRKPKYSEKNLPQCHYVHPKSHMNCSRIEPGHLCSEKSATNHLSYYMTKYGSQSAVSSETADNQNAHHLLPPADLNWAHGKMREMNGQINIYQQHLK